jgi:hypothetical protein
MKTKDRIKEEISLEKLFLTLLIATVSSLLSWTWNNQETLLKEISYFLYLLSIVGSVTALISFIKIKIKIRELDHYE